jgi:hypothetical protein
MPDHRRKPTEPAPSAAAPSAIEPVDSRAAVVTSARRRRLLKAAASAAPVIATLPSGEALANASALQCVINEQNGTQLPATERVADTDPPQDNYVRVPGQIQDWLIPSDPNNPTGPKTTASVYFIDAANNASGQDLYVYGDNGAGFPVQGSWFDITAPGVSGPSAFPPPANVEFLYLYKADNAPITDQSDVAVDGGGLPSDCEIDSTIPAWPGGSTSPVGPTAPQHCFYPMAVQAPQNTPGNVPLTYSCLASFTATA